MIMFSGVRGLVRYRVDNNGKKWRKVPKTPKRGQDVTLLIFCYLNRSHLGLDRAMELLQDFWANIENKKQTIF